MNADRLVTLSELALDLQRAVGIRGSHLRLSGNERYS